MRLAVPVASALSAFAFACGLHSPMLDDLAPGLSRPAPPPAVGASVPAAPPAPATAPTAPAVLPVAESDWAMFRDDAERTGFAEGTHVGDTVREAWRLPEWNKTAYGAAKGSPSIAGGVLYCGSDTGRFVAASADDGGVLWSVQIPATTEGIHGSPAIAGDLVYIATYNGGLYALDRTDGHEAWGYKRGFQSGASPAVVPAWGIVYSAHERDIAGGGYLIALDARSGRRLWEQPTEGHPHSSVAVDEALARVFLGDNRGEVHAYGALDGKPAWTTDLRLRDLDAKVKGTVMVVHAHGLVLASAWSGKMYALRESDGSLAWEHRLEGRLMASPAYDPTLDLVFLGSPGGEVVALSANDGREVWRRALGGAVYSSASVSGDGARLVVGAGWDVVALRTDTGAEVWRRRLDGLVSGSPSLVGDRVYVTTRKGSLWALDTVAGS